MATLIEVVASKIQDLIDASGKYKILKRSDIEELININIERSNVTVEMVNQILSDDFDIIYKDFKKNLSNYPKVKDYYKLFLDKLNAKSKDLEKRKILGSLVYTSAIITKLLLEVQKNIKLIIEEDEISINEIRLSHLSLLGLIKEASTVSEWLYQLFSLFIIISNNDKFDAINYRIDILDKYLSNVVPIVNEIVITGSTFSLFKSILEKRKKDNDPLVNINHSSEHLKSLKTTGLLYDFLYVTGIVRVLGSLFKYGQYELEDYLYQEYQKNKYMKEWLQSVIANHKMTLMQLDENDPEYIRIQKVIESYDNMLTDVERKIQDYIEGAK
jgi:hypothetical protein